MNVSIHRVKGGGYVALSSMGIAVSPVGPLLWSLSVSTNSVASKEAWYNNLMGLTNLTLVRFGEDDVMHPLKSIDEIDLQPEIEL